jgi:hypothetical protein
LNEEWNEFLSATKNSPRLALIEGGVRKVEENSTKEVVIAQGGEMAYVALLAQQAKVRISSPEPSEKEWFDGLAIHFDRNIVAYYDFVRIAYQWNRNLHKTDFFSYVTPFLEKNKTLMGWKEFNFSIDNLLSVHENLFNKPFDPADVVFLKRILDPHGEESLINEVSRYDDSGFRDEIIIKKIEEYWDFGFNLFIVYGLQHAYVQKPFLEQHVLKLS